MTGEDEVSGRGARGELPLFPGPIHGVRIWRLEWEESGELQLTGMIGGAWKRGRGAIRAECDTGHGAPRRDCGCGLYALHPHRVTRLEPWAEPTNTVYGIVAAGGRVEVHEDGFRAEWARPIVLGTVGLSPESDYGAQVRRLADAYGCEVIVLGRKEELADYCEARELGLDRATVRRLLAEASPEPVDEPEMPAPAPAPSRGPLGFDDWWELAAGAGYVAFWGAVIVGVVLAVRAGVFDEEPRLPPLSVERRVQVLEQGVTRVGRRAIYWAKVENRGRQAVLRLRMRGSLRDHDGRSVARLGPVARFDGPANLAAGDTALVFDEVRAPRLRRALRGDGVRFDLEPVARATRPAGPAPFDVAKPRFDRKRCAITAVISAPRGPQRVAISVLGTIDGRRYPGRIPLRRVKAGPERRRIAGFDRRTCRAKVTNLEVFAAPKAEMLRVRR